MSDEEDRRKRLIQRRNFLDAMMRQLMHDLSFTVPSRVNDVIDEFRENYEYELALLRLTDHIIETKQTITASDFEHIKKVASEVAAREQEWIQIHSLVRERTGQ
jgi:hypothetical protein